MLNEEKKNENATLDGSAFARVLGRLMEGKGIPADEEHAVELAEKSGLDPEVFRARLAGDLGASLGDLSRLARELGLSEPEMRVLALAYALEEERDPEELEGNDSRWVPRPEELVERQLEYTPDQRLRPIRCQAGSETDSQCPRDATTWMYPERREYPLCDEHARAEELVHESNEWGLAEEITDDWLRIARGWGNEALEQLAFAAHERAKEEFLKADVGEEFAREVADAPRKSRKNRIADLTPEQDAESRRLMRRADELNNAYTTLQDNSVAEITEENLRRMLAVLVEERDRANEESHRYSEELGIAFEPKK